MRPTVFVPAATFLVVLTVSLVAAGQDASAVLRQAADRIGANGLSSLSFSGSASSYTYNEDGRRQYTRLQTYDQEVRFGEGATRIELGRVEGLATEPEIEVRELDAGMSMVEAAERWLVPHLFLEEARSRNVRTRQEASLGRDYTVVSFDAAGYEVSGYIAADGQLDQVEMTSPAGEALRVRYLGYTDHDGVLFPRMLFLEQGVRPWLVVLVSEVAAEGGG